MKGQTEALRLLQEADVICDAQSVERAVARMAEEITALLHDRFPIVLSVM